MFFKDAVRWRIFFISALAVCAGCSPVSLDKQSSVHTSTETRAAALIPADIPELDASIITSGTLNASLMPAFSGGDVTSSAGSLVLTIAAGAVNSSKLADGAVSTAKILDGAVTAAKLADHIVTEAKLAVGMGVWTEASGNVSRAGGRVGIATASPKTAFDVRGEVLVGNVGLIEASGADNSLAMGSAGPITLGTLSWDGEAPNISTPRMTLLPSGNVGIGTITPAAKLEVIGQVKITGGSPGAGKILTSDGQGLASWEPLPVAEVSQWTTSGANIHFNSGNVGIGTSNPTKPLHVEKTFSPTATLYDGVVAATAISAPPNHASVHLTAFNGTTRTTGQFDNYGWLMGVKGTIAHQSTGAMSLGVGVKGEF